MTQITPHLLTITLSLCLTACSTDTDNNSQPSTQKNIKNTDTNIDIDMSPDMNKNITDMNTMNTDLSPNYTSKICPKDKINNIPTFLYLDPKNEFTFKPWLITPNDTHVKNAVFSYETTDPFINSINTSKILHDESEDNVIITISSNKLNAKSHFAINVISANYNSPSSCSKKIDETYQIYLETLNENFKEIKANKICKNANESITTITKYNYLITFISPDKTTINLEKQFINIKSNIKITVTK